MATKNYAEYIQTEYGSIVGATITKVRLMTDEELDQIGWDAGYGAVPMIIELSNGEILIPSQDPEGNGAGHIFVEDVA